MDGIRVQVLNALPWKEETIDVAAVGRTYWLKLEQRNQTESWDNFDGDADDQDDTEEIDPSSFGEGVELTPQNVENLNNYELLGLGAIGDGISAKQIKAACTSALIPI